VEFRYRLGENEHAIRLEPQRDGTWVARVGERAYRVRLESARAGHLHFAVDDRRYEAMTAGQKQGNLGLSRRYVAVVGSTAAGEPRAARHYELIAATSGEARRTPRRAASAPAEDARSRARLEAQTPGQVVEVMVHEGDAVSKGQPLLVLEAMKMVTRVVAPMAGRVSHVLVRVGDTVERGQRLIDVEPAG
jgi:biotin carboxyl carrier protein